jgi:hypothetical protein
MRVLLISLLFTACGYTDEGDGSGTLQVQADITYTVHNNQMHAEIEVTKGGVPVTDATVTLDPDEGAEATIPFNDGPGNNDDRYRANITSYKRRLQLRIDRGDDWVEVQLEGPGTHSIAEPEAGGIIDAGDLDGDIEVKWKTEDGVKCDEVKVEVRGNNEEVQYENTPDDTGSHDVEGTAFDSGANTIQVTRRNSIRPKGAEGSSYFKIHYQVENSVVVE